MKISCVLPSRNGSRYLRESIESVLAQTFQDWELILIDDASTDETPRIMREYAERDPRIQFSPNPQNLRLPLSLNRGFSLAQGELFTWTSDDNRYLPEAFQKMLATLESEKADLVYADMNEIDEGGQFIRPYPAKPLEEIWKASPVGACFLYKRTVHEKLGGYSDALRLAEDYDFWLRASMRFKMVHLREILYDYRIHGASLTTTQSFNTGRMADRALESSLPQLHWMSPELHAEARFRLLVTAWRRRDWMQLFRQVAFLVLGMPASGVVAIRKLRRRTLS